MTRNGRSQYLFISWTDHSRPRELSKRIGADYLVPARPCIRWWWPLRYFCQAVVTISVIILRQPTAVLFTDPPFIAGLACQVGSRFTRSRCWADCHSGAFNDPRWSRFSSANEFMLRRCSGVIFHNRLIAREQSHVVATPLTLSVFAMSDRASPDGHRQPGQSRPLAVAICSHGFDEPIEAILSAAAALPDIDVAITGRAPHGKHRRDLDNVTFTGWLSDEAYDSLLSEASVALSMTTREGTMQNGVIDALEHKCPVITSSTGALKEWAEGIPGVLTAANEPDAIAAAITEVADNSAAWFNRAASGHRAARERADSEIQSLETALANTRH
jgi:glycosyltransferase involved in cell wall biosynthesis